MNPMQLDTYIRNNSTKDFRLAENFEEIDRVFPQLGVTGLVEYFWPLYHKRGTLLSDKLPANEMGILEYNYAHSMMIDVETFRNTKGFTRNELKDFLRLYKSEKPTDKYCMRDPNAYKKYITQIGFGKSNAYWCYVLDNMHHNVLHKWVIESERNDHEPLLHIIQDAEIFSQIGWGYAYSTIPETMKANAVIDKKYAAKLKELIARACTYCGGSFKDEITLCYAPITSDTAWRYFHIAV